MSNRPSPASPGAAAPAQADPPALPAAPASPAAPPRAVAGSAAQQGQAGGLLLPLGLLTAGLVALIVVLLLFAAREQNDLALKSSQHLAASVIGTLRDEVESKVRDYALWDETVDNVVLTLDPEWADENIGIWAFEGLQLDASLAVDGAGAPIYAMSAGERSDGAELLRRAAHLAPLLEAARRAEVDERGAAVSAYIRLNGKLAIAAAGPIAREDGTQVTSRGGGPSVLVFIRLLDATTLGDLEQSFLLPGLRLLPADASEAEGFPREFGGAMALLPLTDYSGAVLAHLAWRAEQPGFLMLQRLLLPGAAAALLAGLLLWIIVSRAAKATRALHANHAALENQAAELRVARDQAREQIRLEADLRRRADTASRSKSEFLALVSHELRTPLNAILGFSETIANQTFGPAMTERYREYARHIHESGSHLLSLINDILDLTKVEAGRYELHEEELALGPLLQRCATLLGERAIGKGLVLSCPDTRIVLRADARAIKQIVINLLTNAIKFTNAGGRIELQARAAPEGVEIVVVDNGIGMSREDLARALQPFGQAASALTRTEEGTGLGLNISKAMAELHGGRLILKSAPGQGTTVIVRLPLTRLVSAELPVDG